MPSGKLATPRRACVIGAGAVGLSAAIQLRRRGIAVTVIEEGAPASGASYGNSGMLVADTALPTPHPGMIWKVPGWLMDPLGPLTIKASYLPSALPWLWRYLLAGTRRRFFEGAKALRTLHAPTFEGWRDNVGSAVMDRLIRHSGQVYLWERLRERPVRGLEDEVRAMFGIESELLGVEQVRQYFPGISRDVSHGLLVPGNGHSVDPGALVEALAAQFLSEGGIILRERVLKLWPGQVGSWHIMTNFNNHYPDIAVIAAGAWSARLLAPLGVRVPLESERGYHVMLRNPSVTLGMPILNKSGYFGICSMAGGLRLSGTVEIAGLEAPPTLERAKILVTQAKRLFPDLAYDEEIYWMGHRPSTPDGLPVIGPIRGHLGLFACFGHGHCGLTAAPASAKLLAQMITGEPPDVDSRPFAADRF